MPRFKLFGPGPTGFYGDLIALGLGTDLECCFDAGAIGSWPGNYLARSQELDLTPWNVSNTTVTADATTAPDGTTTAEKIVETTANGAHIVYQSVTFAANTRYTFSAYVKASDRTQFSLYINGTGWAANYAVIFDTSDQTWIAGDTAPQSYGYTSVGSGWYRIWMSQVTDGTGGASNFQPGLAKAGARVYVGTTAEGGFMWGAQVELGSGPPLRYVATGAAGQQKLVDLSVNQYDFWRGADGAATTDDPTFNGTAGALTSAEYFSFDAGDFFRSKDVAGGWEDSLHKDNVKFTAVALFYNVASTGNNGIFGTNGTGTAIGARLDLVSGVPRFTVTNGTAISLEVTADATVSTSAWHMLAVAIDENAGAGGGFLYKDGDYTPVNTANTWNPAYSSPSLDGAANAFEIGAVGAGGSAMQNTARLAGFFLWEGRVLTKAQLDAIWNRVRKRFSI